MRRKQFLWVIHFRLNTDHYDNLLQQLGWTGKNRFSSDFKQQRKKSLQNCNMLYYHILLHFHLAIQVRFDHKIGMFHYLNENILAFLVKNRSSLRIHCQCPLVILNFRLTMKRKKLLTTPFLSAKRDLVYWPFSD